MVHWFYCLDQGLWISSLWQGQVQDSGLGWSALCVWLRLGKSVIKNNHNKAERLKHEKGFIYKVLGSLNNYCSFSCSVHFRSLRTSITLRVIAWGSTNTLSFKNPSIACGSRTDKMKESSSRPCLKACRFQKLCFSWLQYIFFCLYTTLLKQPI